MLAENLAQSMNDLNENVMYATYDLVLANGDKSDQVADLADALGAYLDEWFQTALLDRLLVDDQEPDDEMVIMGSDGPKGILEFQFRDDEPH